MDEAFKTPINAGRVLSEDWCHVYDVPVHPVSEEHSGELPPASPASLVSLDVAVGHSLEEELQAFLSFPSVPSRLSHPAICPTKEPTSPQAIRNSWKEDSKEKHEQQLEAANAHIRSLHFQITQLQADEEQVLGMLKAKCRTLEQKLAAAEGTDVDEAHLKDPEQSPIGTAHTGSCDMSKDTSDEELRHLRQDIGCVREQMASMNQEVAGMRAALASAPGASRGSGGILSEFEGDIREKLHELCADVAEIKQLLARRSIPPRLARDLVSAEETSRDTKTGEDAGGDTKTEKRSRRTTRVRASDLLEADESTLTWEVH